MGDFDDKNGDGNDDDGSGSRTDAAMVVMRRPRRWVLYCGPVPGLIWVACENECVSGGVERVCCC